MRLDKVRAFTLIEVLVSVAILVLMITILTSFMSAVTTSWVAGEQRASTFQDGRAILDVIGRELSHAAISPTLQFVVTSSAVFNVNATRTNSDSIFWQAPLTYRVSGSATPTTNLCEVGYYIDPNYNLKRFFSQPADSNYQIYIKTPTDAAAPWATGYFNASGASNTIAAGIVALWVRCLDANGDLIQWVPSSSYHFNSAAHFRPATLGASSSFTYTASSTAQANLLPNSVELTIVVIDDKTLRRSLANPAIIPAMPAVVSPAGVPAAINTFNTSLIANKVTTARTFTSQVVIPNSSRQ